MRFNKGYARAEITVFLTLVFGIISALAITVTESARNQATRVQVERVMQTSIHSCFSEYNQDLLTYYEILAIDSSYRGAQGNIDNVTEHLREYAALNFESEEDGVMGSDWLKLSVDDLSLRQYELLSDNDATPMKNQINEYMSENGPLPFRSELIQIKNHMSIRDDGEFISAFTEAIERAGCDNNPADEIYDIAVSTDILEFVMADGYDYKSVPANSPSRRYLRRGTGRNFFGRNITYVDSEYLLNSYIMDRFSNCVIPFDHSYMGAEKEYIISGNISEADCIRECARWILAQREMKNLRSMEENEEVLNRTEDLSIRLCENGGDQYHTQRSLIYAWTYVESLLQVNALLRGGSVDISLGITNPVIPLSEILMFREYLGSSGGNEGGTEYGMILSGMMLYEDDVTKIKRCMDIIEMNMNNLGHEGFKVDACVTHFKAKLNAASTYGHDCEIEREYGYYKE